MRQLLVRRLVPLLLVISLAHGPAWAQLPGLGRGKESKEDRDKRKAEEKLQKNLERFERLKAYIAGKEADPDFKDEVEQKYEGVMRDHSERAYQKNITRNSYLRTVHEDTWRVHEGLYDNLLVQDHINRIGQRLVPEGSERMYAFKVIPDPIPSAETLSTGTIYISTGLISLLDSEAQLAYVLAHEMAHVHHDHWRERVRLQVGSEFQAAEQAERGRRIALASGILGGVLGGVAGRGVMDAAAGSALGASAGWLISALVNRPLIVDWDRTQEDQADETAFKAVMGANYDAREVPKLYMALEHAVVRDTRVGLGFMGNRKRVAERRERVNGLLEGAYKADMEAKLKGGSVIADSAEHSNLMAELKRDNGIMAYYNDMFGMALGNLRQAAALRANDPAVHYFHGKVLKLVGRTAEEQREAKLAFQRANQHDHSRQNYGAHLHYALALRGERRDADKTEIVKELDQYVSNHARWLLESGIYRFFPPNLDSIYEYMRLYGDPGWRPKAPELTDMPDYRLLFERASLMPGPSVEAARVQPAAAKSAAEAPAGRSGSAPSVVDQGMDVLRRVTPGRVGQAVQSGDNIRRNAGRPAAVKK